MPKPLKKSLQEYLSKIKKPSTPHIHLPSKPISSSASWIFRGCKHPKTLSFTVDHDQNDAIDDEDNAAATLSDVDSFLFENFKSLYRKEDENDDNDKKGDQENGEEQSGGFRFDSTRSIDPPPDLCGSHRFFVESGSSSSLIEETRMSATMSEDMGSSSTTSNTLNDSTKPGDVFKKVMGPEDFIAVLTYSRSPYYDFRHSMQEMIEARLHHNGRVDWGFMEELLFCYLNLNNKKSYKYILSAYADMIVLLRENSGKLPVRSGGERRKKRGDVV